MKLTPYEMELIAQALHIACGVIEQPRGEQMLALRDKIEGAVGLAPEPVLRRAN